MAVGLPCHVHALRKAQLENVVEVSGRVGLIIGLFCAAQFYFEGTRHILSEKCGISDLDAVRRLRYREGPWPGNLVVETAEGRTTVDRNEYLYRVLLAGYKRDRCEMCVDWASEVADVAVGDYWAGLRTGEEGLSTVVVRTATGERLVESALRDGALVGAELGATEIQGLTATTGFETKKHAAAFRLLQRRRFGWPTPDFQLEIVHDPEGRGMGVRFG